MSSDHSCRMGNADWADRPPSESELFIPIYSPKHQAPVNLIIVGPELRGVYTHFVDKRTRPCTVKEGNCIECGRNFPRRWKGYVAGYDPNRSRYALGEVTAEAFRKCPQLELQKGQLRGMRIRIERINAHNNAPCRASLSPGIQGAFIPEPFDIATALYRVWGMIQESWLELDEG